MFVAAQPAMLPTSTRTLARGEPGAAPYQAVSALAAFGTGSGSYAAAAAVEAMTAG
ncbi:hypothetical protein I546_1526 [Mycobacterium kansasii 732]|uniref:Uncharacterized protein n=1 Tax=Mycobacterium pseudokansasii TaxID=2341080 RepID=A0A498QIM1_9MYCO|nr:hypothetical protein [Mycobacterium pseudokansasii]EUA14321.1 hypothetical protein I546_1526 [Mycobacterium kansasii 732]VAZ87595.1 hypothetical protein LAUMK35_00281 [Mycobacterium pseudokansasii]VAZ87977.1 hypothetical protein LAUMK21_00280 [Mycobacterium pseudokansasii]VBA45867.1 hypothetical protein LAUMK142_00141 [Mycobacterium pseudokansasii]